MFKIFLNCLNSFTLFSYIFEIKIPIPVDISITQEDKDILKELGKVLGQTDADSQVNEIEVTESFLNMQIEKAEEARKKNQKMYKTLGVVVGLVFVIILI